ncbi:MAG: hypothetical protein H7836_09595 [Magnetococcus sp. YQC-3]
MPIYPGSAGVPPAIGHLETKAGETPALPGWKCSPLYPSSALSVQWWINRPDLTGEQMCLGARASRPRSWVGNASHAAKAKTACEVFGHPAAHHFVGVNKMVNLGSGSQRQIDDVVRARYAWDTLLPED